MAHDPRACRLRAWAAALIVAAGAVAYAPSFAVPFVYDDLPILVDRPAIRMSRLGWTAVVKALELFPASRWLAHVSFALNRLLGGLDPAGYHAVNLAFHLAAALVAGLLAGEVLARALPDEARPARDRMALIAALLFALHPVQTQAVTYVVQRMTSMGGFFALLSLWLFLRGRRSGAPRPWAHLSGAAAAALAAFSCKESYVVVPALAAVLELLLVPGLGDRVRRHPRIASGAGLAAAAIGLAAALHYAPYLVRGGGLFGLSPGDRLLTQGRILWHYLALLALPLPSRLHVVYAWPPSTSLLEPVTTLPAILGLAALVAAAVALRRRFVLATLAVAWFLVALSVEQSVLPLDLVFEHRLYLPAFGWLVLVAVGIERFAARLGRVRWVGLALPIALLALGTWQRNLAWQDPVRLFAEAEGDPSHRSNGLLIAALAVKQSGRVDEAKSLLRRALELNPLNGGAMLGLASIAAERDQVEVADGWFRRARETDPYSIEFWLAYGGFLLRQGRHVEAEDAYRTLLASMKALRAALPGVASTLPGEAEAHLNLGQVLAASGRREEAREHYDAALRIDPDLGLAYYGRAWLELAERGPAAALGDAQRAAELQPGEARVQELLAEILGALGRTDEALVHARRATELAPAPRGP
jgi:tetratricopeptide (TPR) repeat protein